MLIVDSAVVISERPLVVKKKTTAIGHVRSFYDIFSHFYTMPKCDWWTGGQSERIPMSIPCSAFAIKTNTVEWSISNLKRRFPVPATPSYLGSPVQVCYYTGRFTRLPPSARTSNRIRKISMTVDTGGIRVHRAARYQPISCCYSVSRTALTTTTLNSSTCLFNRHDS